MDTTTAIPRAKLQELIDAINREGGWRDTDTVGELLTQFLDAEGFDLTPPAQPL